MEIYGIKSHILKPRFDLIESLSTVLAKNRKGLAEKDILVISSKILAIAQGRILDLKSIRVSKQAKVLRITRYGRGKEDPRITEIVLREADAVFPGSMLLTLKDSVLIPLAGIDLSNAEKGKAILWPENPWQTARIVWKKLKKRFHLKKIGVVISDSHCQPLRWGVTGLALAWAGFLGIEDARGQKDIYGKPLRVTKKAVADNLASAALVLMGEGGEKIPFVLIRNAPVKFTNRTQSKKEIFIKPKDCLFNGIYSGKFKKMLG